MSWISVIDEMPKKHHQVLAIDTNNEQAVCIYKGSNEWRYMGCYDDCCGCDARNITHWMELPDVPAK